MKDKIQLRPFAEIKKIYYLDNPVVASRFQDKQTKLMYAHIALVSHGIADEYFNIERTGGWIDYILFDRDFCKKVIEDADEGYIKGIKPTAKWEQYNNPQCLPLPKWIPKPLNNKEYGEYYYNSGGHNMSWNSDKKRDYALARWPDWAIQSYCIYIIDHPNGLGIHKSGNLSREHALRLLRQIEGTQNKTPVPASTKAASRVEKWKNVANDPNAAEAEREFALRRLNGT